MGLFTSTSQRRVEALAGRLTSPLNAIALALAGVASDDELHGVLTRARPQFTRSTQLGNAEWDAAYQRYWTAQRPEITALCASGTTTVEHVRQIQQEWIRSLRVTATDRAHRAASAERAMRNP
jgi:hypothetical protein